VTPYSLKKDYSRRKEKSVNSASLSETEYFNVLLAGKKNPASSSMHILLDKTNIVFWMITSLGAKLFYMPKLKHCSSGSAGRLSPPASSG